jgi:beta-N-acetylhexosaminidase
MEHLSVMKDEFERYGIEVKTYHNKCTDEQWPETDLIVYATFCHQHKPCGFLDIQPSWQTASYKRECVVVCSFGSPYLINQYFPTVNKALAMYSDTDGCMRAAVRAMLGKIKMTGTLPVTLQEY